MARSIIIVNATQVVTSEQNPNGLFSVVNGFPKVFDSGYDGDVDQNMNNAKSAYHAQLSTNYANTNASRVMMTVTIERANGEQIDSVAIGRIPGE